MYNAHVYIYVYRYTHAYVYTGIPRWLSGKESACKAGDMGLITESGRSPGEGNGNPLQYSCLENPMYRGTQKTIVHGVSTDSDMT